MATKKDNLQIYVTDIANTIRAENGTTALINPQDFGSKIKGIGDKLRKLVSGTLKEINALELGKLSVKLGAGRVNKEDKINHGVGIYLEKLVGDSVKKDDVLARIFVDKIPDKLKISNIFVIN